MNLPRPHDKLALTGVKTTHRTPTAPNARAGHDYPLRGHPDTRIHVLTITQGLLELAAHRTEGFRTELDYAAAWLRQHDKHWPPTTPCTACDGDGTTDCPDCWDGQVRVHPLDAHHCEDCAGTGHVFAFISHALVLHRFHQAHAGRPIWVVAFKLTDAPRYLARPIPGKQGDYTRNPARAIDDLEPVSIGDLRPLWADKSCVNRAGAEHPSTRARRLSVITRRAA